MSDTYDVVIQVEMRVEADTPHQAQKLATGALRISGRKVRETQRVVLPPQKRRN